MADWRAQSSSQCIDWGYKGEPSGAQCLYPFSGSFSSSSQAQLLVAMATMKCDASLQVSLSPSTGQSLPCEWKDPSEGKSMVWCGGGCRTAALGGSPAPTMWPVAQTAVVLPPSAASIDAFPTLRLVESLSRCPSLENGRILAMWVIRVLLFYQRKSQLSRNSPGLCTDKAGWGPPPPSEGQPVW